MNLKPFHPNSYMLITGSSHGIGAVFAERFAQEGWNLVLVARSGDQLDRLAKNLETRYRIKVRVIVCDLSKHDAVGRILAEVARDRLEIEGLINNAGFGQKGKFFEVPVERYLEMIDLLVRTLTELTHVFLQPMLKKKRGLVINVSSTASFQPLPFSAVYAAAKAFVTSLTEALWLETRGTGVHVLNMCPGLTKTGFGSAAGMHDFRTDPMAQTPEQVVETAFRALRKGRPAAVSGFRNRLLIFVERLMPHRLLLEGIQIYQKRRYKS